MDLREFSRSGMKPDVEDCTDLKGDRVAEDEELNGSDKRKHRSNKSRKHSNVEEAEEWDNSGRRRSSGDRIESRKRSGGSSRVESGDEDEYDTRKELRSKLVKKNQEDKIDKKLSSGYQGTETEGNRKGRDISGSKGHGITDDSEKEPTRKSGTKPPIHESSQSRSRTKVNSSHDGQEKIKDRDSKYAEKKESSRDKGHGSRETDSNTKKRGDESDLVRKGEESNYVDKPESRSGKVPDVKHGNARDKTSDIRIEPIENKSKVGDSSSDKVIKSSNRNDEEKRIDEKIRSRGRPDGREEDIRPGSINREEKSGDLRDDKLRTVREKPIGFSEDTETIPKSSARGQSEKIETHRHRPDAAHGVHDSVDSRERSVNIDEDGRGRTRDRSGREIRPSKRSWSPERVGKRHPQSGEYESDNERSVSLKGKERERESYRDDWSKGRDSSWNERNKDRDGSKDNWKRRHDSNADKDVSYVVDFDHGINWDPQRRDRERNDNDKPRNHPGYRKTGWIEGGKALLSYGGGNRSSDMIEIRPTSIDYGREGSELLFTGKKTEGSAPKDYTSATGDDQWGYPPEDKTKMTDNYDPNDDVQQRYPDDVLSAVDQNSGRNNMDVQGERGRGQRGVVGSNRTGGGPSPSGLSQSPFGNNQGSGNFSRITPQGAKGSRLGRGGRGRLTGREGQRVGIPMPMMGSPFGPLGLPPGPMQTLGPNMSPGPGPGPGPPMVLGGFIPQFPGPNAWPGARGLDMNMLSVQHGLSPVPPVQSQPRFPLNVVSGPNPTMYFNQQGPVRGVSPSIPGPGYNAMGTIGRGLPNDKALGIWNAPRTSGPPGKAPSRGEQNDYSQNFVDTGMRPQNYIRELELTNTVEDYPKLRELIQRKDEIVAKSTTPPMYYKCDLREFVLSSEFFGTKFDVILVDPPWEEYVHRAPGSADHMEYWTFEEISNLKIEAIADTPSFIFLWVGDGVGLEQGRQCLRKWGFRRCEDICWVKTNKSNATSGLRHDSHTLFQHSKEHCLMGIKGTVRRSTDGHIIHANIDTDIVIAEESPYGSTAKPEDMYRIIEHFSLGRRRIELFGEDHNIRPGWLTVGKGLSSSDFNAEAYIKNFCDKDGKVWQGGGGRNPPPGASHLVVTTPEIEGLRPKSPPQKNQQQQNSITLTQTTTNSTNRSPVVNSRQNPNVLEINPEVSSSNNPLLTPAPWAASPAVSSKPPDTVAVVTEDKFFDNFAHDPSGGQANVDHINFGSHGGPTIL